MGGIRVDPGPLDDNEAARRWSDNERQLQGPARYGIDVVGTQPAPPEPERTRQYLRQLPQPERTRQYLRQLLIQGLDAAGVPSGSQPEPSPRVQGTSVTYTPPTMFDRLRMMMPKPELQVPQAPAPRPEAKPAPDMPVSPRGQANRVQYALSSQPLGGVEPKLLQDLGKHLGMDPLDVVQLGRSNPDLLVKLSMEMDNMQAEGYSPDAIAYVLRAMIGQTQQQPNINASLTRR